MTITATGLPVFFAHPHSPWERGSNENLNRIVREYFPKGDTTTFFVEVGTVPPVDSVSGVLTRLAHLGYYAGPVDDGAWGDDAAAALSAFQAVCGDPDVEVTGVVDDNTKAALTKAHGS